MANSKHEFTTAVFEDGTCAVLRADPNKPRILEVIATFYDAAHARDYARFQNTPAAEDRQEQPVIKQAAEAKPKPAYKAEPKQAFARKPRPASEAKPQPIAEAKALTAVSDVSERQGAVLKALRSMMDKRNRVEAPVAELARASSIPLGSLHSILASLEKKQMIRTERPGSAKFRAIYEVLAAPRKSARSINGAAHGKKADATITAH